MESSRPNRPRPTPKKHALDNEEHRFIPVSTYSQIRRQRLSRVCFIALLAYFVGGWFGEFGLGNSGIVVGDNDFNFKDKDWKERGEVNGVMLYDYVGKNAPGKITPLRGTIIVNLHVGYIMDVLLNINRSKEWVKDLHSVSEFDAVNLDGTLLQRYRIMLGLGFIADRELLIRRKVKKNNFAKKLEMRYESVEDDVRWPVCKGCVRSWTEGTVWRFRSLENGHTAIDLVAFVNPNGHLPSKLVNWIQRTWPATTLSKLVKTAAKRGHKKHPLFLKW